MKCQKCGADVPILDLNVGDKHKVSDVARRISRLKAVIELRNAVDVDLGEAKSIVFHISSEDGKCSRCDYDLLTNGSAVQCPDCLYLN
jgi:hypothetical protein